MNPAPEIPDALHKSPLPPDEWVLADISVGRFQGRISMRTNRRTFTAVAVLGLVAAGGSAFTAANTTTPIASAGYQGTVTSGFAVSAVQYELGDPTNPADANTGNDVVAVQFTLTPAADALPAKQVRVRLKKADATRAAADGGPITEGGYYHSGTGGTCAVVGTPAATAGTATTWKCTTLLPSPLESIDINTLDIVANSQETIAAGA